MVSHNNVLPNVHLHKWWQRYVRVNFSKNIKKKKRRLLREKRRKANGGTPIEKLHPIVHCPTQRYNFRCRLGKGFTLEELKGAKLNPLAAQSIGICVDKRRKNRCEETLKKNIERLEKYKKCLVMIPLKSTKTKKGIGGIPEDTSKDVVKELRKKKQLRSIFKKERNTKPFYESMDVSKIDKSYLAYKTLRRAKLTERRKNKQQQKKDLKRKSKDN
ncbi:60S ribosomal protein L13, putative [Plasmodium knowlesi strain H]|uniref:60S ribosomal protein L13, putative n=3 Tax=Plasmodium knowlesi TaxID=5850 RepID=A0A5K1VTI7_PLAKH|nr:60S ribosomal protein L13-2, putative [Plasmodium knowlesi strain H]OTN63702.1 putative 60S ribosomal protein L13 [Plasmodium knowlesi]CAA9990860.1 60S ribosomal protein L13-2, putative [Plasmodium knowlesi strain H]SBO20921.1 60S ribosomal protein L13, putative [Plasmodium knowlesi strain H]SBO21412.1 60S ribosomal protein L13, putative [Plasmodium knowlesi strain H]VVS80334.1 60S ribosomal protein L13-2, putative [Plasmodium knowlesi strain H]|eukprot:XP_002262148.1 60S ribosomal protein L13, putative [Plasmodium knowlesi strain H]